MSDEIEIIPLANRFRGFLPVVVDVETGGFNSRKDALLELAAVILRIDEKGELSRYRTHHWHIEPFPNANMDPKSLEINGIKPFSPLRLAIPEERALNEFFKVVRKELKLNRCNRSILVGHNAPFDLNFLNAASERIDCKRNPFHPFSTLDTVTLGALVYGQTVLARIAQAAGMGWDGEQAHSAVYDAEKTADIFCHIVNTWQTMDAAMKSVTD
ncbi:ribonuclease T [Thiolinea disciformis]|uniref:ribonuclease T n=1 Tax=Thiolinea disciformis TaxID=125614 RepID=UPI000366AD4A|nr:ribonuclease T [Thiolinea disciformis]